MVKTLVEKVTSPKPDVTIFKISGTLGFHENEVLTRFFSECQKKNITKLVMDFSGLSSLGGGCAKIIREHAERGNISICIAGASQFVRKYLDNAGAGAVLFASDVSRAVDQVDEHVPTPTVRSAERVESAASAEPAAAAAPPRVEQPAVPLDELHAGIEEILGDDAAWDRDREPLVIPEQDDESSAAAGPATQPATEPTAKPSSESSPSEPLAPAPTPEPAAAGPEATGEPEPDDAGPSEVGEPTGQAASKRRSPDAPDLHRKLVQYRSLLSLTSDFNRIRDKGKLLDAFLLTTIAQVGVESAAFLEYDTEEFVPVCWKGFETADPTPMHLKTAEVDLDAWREKLGPLPLEDAPIQFNAKNRLAGWGMPYIAPFVVHDNFRGLVLLGRPIRNEFDQASWDYLSVLINQAAIAYENTQRFQEESERTLGLVQTMVSLIEENTITRGSTDMVVNYTYVVAQRMHYPEEFVRDLMYGAVLRDIGMIKISDLIVRSPRELVKEEWEIIRQHPSDGAEMLRRMNFSEHTVRIVESHHERFNGEGYPHGLNGKEIPLGARIVSVVESYIAMIQDRPTRPALSREEAVNTLNENWGIRYDPEVVKAFAAIVEDEIRTGQKVKHQGSEILNL